MESRTTDGNDGPIYLRKGYSASADYCCCEGFTPGTPAPLVIQTYHYYPQFFLPDGPHSSSDAAQALVAKGMAVFQIESMDVGRSSQREGPEFVQRLDTAVDALAPEGSVDGQTLE